MKSKIAVIGGGIAGLTTVYRLLQKDFQIKLYEAQDRLGGLARTIKIRGEPVEAFYHHFFLGDEYLLRMCKELGIDDRVRWLNAKMGYLSDAKVFGFGTPLSLLFFKPLALRDKIRFGISILKIRREKSLEKLDQYTAEEWLIKNVGEKVFNVVWKPLLIQKFGDAYNRVSMAWLWKKIQTRSSSKKSILGNDILGYLDGGSQILIDKLAERINHLGGEIASGERVERIYDDGSGKYVVKTQKSEERFEVVVSTVPAPILDKLSAFPLDFNFTLRKLKQLGAICVLAVLKRNLSRYYWLNIGDNSFPFGLLVEHTNFWSKERYGNRHVIYLSKYLDAKDKLFSGMSDEEIKTLFLKQLTKINRDFNREWVEEVYVFREPLAQPIICKNYSRIKPEYTTTLPGFYWISTNHIYPDDRGINHSIKIAGEVTDLVAKNVNRG